MFTMRLEGGAPIYEQLERRITELIISGEMAEGEKLPAVREIAKQLAINPNTVQKTYAKLEAVGLIYSIPAKGSYVSASGKYLDAVRARSRETFSDAVTHALRQGLEKPELMEIIDEVTEKDRG
ncbi:MAG: GntR family transcriptional regulator [Oscillospiraceae bacterium]|nr:GntR family transcriptional regulator [Oscillospiraceae bacterium]